MAVETFVVIARMVEQTGRVKNSAEAMACASSQSDFIWVTEVEGRKDRFTRRSNSTRRSLAITKPHSCALNYTLTVYFLRRFVI